MKVTSKHFAALALLALLACGTRAPTAPAAAHASETAEPPAPQRSEALCGEDAPDTASRCACLGGYVHTPEATGGAPCPQGETQLGRVLQGDASGVCCKGFTQ